MERLKSGPSVACASRLAAGAIDGVYVFLELARQVFDQRGKSTQLVEVLIASGEEHFVHQAIPGSSLLRFREPKIRLLERLHGRKVGKVANFFFHQLAGTHQQQRQAGDDVGGESYFLASFARTPLLPEIDGFVQSDAGYRVLGIPILRGLQKGLKLLGGQMPNPVLKDTLTASKARIQTAQSQVRPLDAADYSR